MLRYYIDVTKFNLAFSICCMMFFGPVSGALVFGIIGTGIGVWGYSFFHSNEYFGYFNLGFTKRQLIKRVWLINAGLSLPLLGLATLVATFF